MTNYSIGFTREDGDFQILSTLNNNANLINPSAFETIKHKVEYELSRMLPDKKIETIVRQDAPDSVSLED